MFSKFVHLIRLGSAETPSPFWRREMVKKIFVNIKKNIPNAITCLNLLCGCMGIIFALKGNTNLLYASYFIGLAAIFDFLDGFVARLLKVHSEIGKQLDSLADMVTFGVLPGIIMFQLICKLEGKASPIAFIALLIPVFSAIRLAKFNIDTRQSDSFIGVPTPATAILVASLPVIHVIYNLNLLLDKLHPQQPGTHSFIIKVSLLLFHTYSLVGITILMSFLMVSELPLFALKFKNFSWTDNKIRFIFLGLSLVMLIAIKLIAVPFIIVLYILLSVVNNLFKKAA